MDRDIMLLVTGALISLLSSFLTSVFNHRLARRQWMEREQWEVKKKLREELRGTWQDLRNLIVDDIRGQVLGSLRGANDTEKEGGLLPTAISRLKVSTRQVVEALNSQSESIEIGELLHLALDSLNTDTD